MVTIYSLDILFPNFEPVHYFLSSQPACWTAYRFLRRQVKVVWYPRLFKNFPQFFVIRTVKGFSVVNEAEVDVFLEFPCFFCDATNVGNFISGSFTFSKSILYIWKFLVHVYRSLVWRITCFMLNTVLGSIGDFLSSLKDTSNGNAKVM